MHFSQNAAAKPRVTLGTDTPETIVHHQLPYSGVLEQREFSKHTKVDSTMGFSIRPFRQLRSVCCNRSPFVWSYLELLNKSKIKRVWATWCIFSSTDCWCRVKIVCFGRRKHDFSGSISDFCSTSAWLFASVFIALHENDVGTGVSLLTKPSTHFSLNFDWIKCRLSLTIITGCALLFDRKLYSGPIHCSGLKRHM